MRLDERLNFRNQALDSRQLWRNGSFNGCLKLVCFLDDNASESASNGSDHSRDFSRGRLVYVHAKLGDDERNSETKRGAHNLSNRLHIKKLHSSPPYQVP
jgi:hypothetical protein